MEFIYIYYTIGNTEYGLTTLVKNLLALDGTSVSEFQQKQSTSYLNLIFRIHNEEDHSKFLDNDAKITGFYALTSSTESPAHASQIEANRQEHLRTISTFNSPTSATPIIVSPAPIPTSTIIASTNQSLPAVTQTPTPHTPNPHKKSRNTSNSG